MNKISFKEFTNSLLPWVMDVLREDIGVMPTGNTYYFNCTPTMRVMIQRMFIVDQRFVSTPGLAPDETSEEGFRFQGNNIVLINTLDLEGVHMYVVREGKMVLYVEQEK